MKVIDLDTMMHFCTSVQRRLIKAIGGQAKFKFEIVNDTQFTIFLSSGQETNVSRGEIREVINKFSETQSFTTTDYSKITRHASYLLALIKLYIERDFPQQLKLLFGNSLIPFETRQAINYLWDKINQTERNDFINKLQNENDPLQRILIAHKYAIDYFLLHP